MRDRLNLSMFWSRPFLTSKWMLWSLLWINGLGTIYGYYWYSSQLIYTWNNKPLWMMPFVPDSPTASLFFTAAIGYLLIDRYRNDTRPSIIRSIIEALALVTSFKYGIWAVVMIFAGHYQGVPSSWQDWMLIASHLGMAAEALLFARFFRITQVAWLVAGVWILANDYIDYTFGIFPALPRALHDDLYIIAWFTWGLSLFSLLLFIAIDNYIKSKKTAV